VGLTWDSALHKFGVDRLAGVRNDYGRLDVFRFGFAMAIAEAWRGQTLADGLPIVTTRFERDGIQYDIEQFAAPLHGPPAERRGNILMVLLQKVHLRELTGRRRTATVAMDLEREAPGSLELREEAGGFVLASAGENGESHAWLVVQGTELKTTADTQTGKARVTASIPLPARGAREFVVKLPSPVVYSRDFARLLGMDYAKAREATVRFWSGYLDRGARFIVPEEAVNSLFRANLWHALRLPRRHGASGSGVKIDLPYSNFAYGQSGTPWPVNQAVYVDYMLYDLRGYHAVSAEELAVMYRGNQEPNGHMGGFANWGVYTPAMIYSVAQHYLLSGDRMSFETLLPPTLRAMDWCLGQLKGKDHETPGLVLAPLNDGSSEPRAWAFNQAYFLAAFDLLGRALTEIGHPRAGECRAAASAMEAAVERGFGRASARSPAVQLADGTWVPYVPSDARGSGRLMKEWYPTDVDTGPLHLPRLKALDPEGPLTTFMLHDHEDNLFIHQWGTINEPVYNMQGTAYLLRDEPKAAIRTFYSTMACAFSHSAFEPVEHRWNWGQYFGPPSTDGAWFELYRNLLIQEREHDGLVLCQATPRAWLEDRKSIEVNRAPTWYGPISFRIESRAAMGEIAAEIEWPERKQAGELLVRFRHPEGKPMRAVRVDGEEWREFDVEREWVRLERPAPGRHQILVRY
jgi:hypothetical protein